jgi:hypothetical protein
MRLIVIIETLTRQVEVLVIFVFQSRLATYEIDCLKKLHYGHCNDDKCCAIVAHCRTSLPARYLTAGIDVHRCIFPPSMLGAISDKAGPYTSQISGGTDREIGIA